tara:strand:+ start:651 stop:818 length:168 start_codon:yes stop_codon:yes gene_type:complete
MKEKFEDVLKRELKAEFKKQMDVDVNEEALDKVLKQYRKVKKSPLNEIRRLDKKS